MSVKGHFVALALVCVATLAHAEPKPPKAPSCHPLAQTRVAVAKVRGGAWTPLNADQLQFARDLYIAMPPPSGAPQGKTAFVSLVDGDLGAVVIFTDGDQSCGIILGLPPVFLQHLIDLGGKDGL